MRPLVPVLALVLLGADPVARLAPGPAELTESLRATELRARRAEAIETASSRLQNAWGERLATGQVGARPCDAPLDRSLLVRTAVFGPALRDATQAARAARDRLVEIAAAPTVAPLLDPETRAELDAATDRVRRLEAAYVESLAWQSTYVRLTRACGDAPEPAAGLADPNLQQAAAHGPVAVIGVGGVLCPGAAPADGRVHLVAGEACVQAAPPCACTPSPVLPGAVLGPPE